METIWIASDDETLGEYLYHHMADLGPISRACRLGDLLRKIRGEERMILLLDESLEGVPAYDLLPLVKKMNSQIPIIILSQDSSLEGAKRLRQEGVFFVAMKPVDPAEIRAAAQDAARMLGQSEKRREKTMAKVIALRPAEEPELARVYEICDDHQGRRGDLLIVLQKVQGLFGYVPRTCVEIVAQSLGISASEIFGVLTFYNRFHLVPQGKHTVRACRGTACHFKGAPSIIESIRKHLKLEQGAETTNDKLFSLEEVACLGACGISPVMTLDEETFGNLTPAMALEAIARCEAAEKISEEEEEKKAA